ncbi:hypothetical protein CVT25_006172 [Psilocybe cyanescens]|uniref:Uncharacterized protein n=1 Tax=Psilocybe cyanescens TaxID=93625 RepID=A0A409XIN9_PSICY|nr:hypothetical protein CVT25_006172 [Psilocybe cyanescens]
MYVVDGDYGRSLFKNDPWIDADEHEDPPAKRHANALAVNRRGGSVHKALDDSSAKNPRDLKSFELAVHK